MSFKLEKNLGVDAKLHSLFANIPDDAVLNPDLIADILCVSAECVRRWCRCGMLASYSFGGKYVITGSDFKEFMQKARTRNPLIKGLDK